ncbi:Rieske 2Fe-2S domain-containing protein [Rubrobacter marinus]|uniref:Cytochrome bc1 complex Rieske iron-sulfur subunit n=2 Tax=Rubrobacter marinus TaxID=2653852 RepID=A0A6G8Q3A0_9ACTN|nr:Rieske 2Fe-2S domain-containing protein [Rubrobacter marinus]
MRLSAALGVGAASASVLAACGGGGGEQGGSGGGASQQATDSGATGGVEGATQASGETAAETTAQQQGSQAGAIASESEVATGAATEFTDSAGQPAVLVHLDNGDFVAYSAVCTHAQCTVAYNNGQLACPCHGSVFDPANGASVVNGPANTPLPEIPVEVRDGQVFTA